MSKEYGRRGFKVRKWIGNHKYFPTYARAICREWMDFLFGVTPLAAFFLIYWALANPGKWPLVVIFVGALVLAGFYAWHAEYSKNMPRFEVSRFLIRKREIRIVPNGETTGREGMYVQLAPACLTEVSISNCQALLIRAFKKSDSGWVETGINEASPLLWASRVQLVSGIVLEPRAESPVNVCHTDSANRDLHPDAIHVPFNTDLTAPGQFSFDIKFTAKDCTPIYRSLEVNIGKSWDEVSCTLWDDLTEEHAKKRLG